VTAVLSTFNATPVTSWEAPDHVWHAARAKGIGASSAATVLGFIKWRTPWQVWADLTDAPSLLARRVGAVQRRKAGKDEVDAIDIQLKALIGDHDVARIGDRDAYSWSEKRGVIDWPRFYAEAVEAGTELPDPELYRKPPTRSLNVKDSQ
jgi:hypothetical protein